MIDAGEQNVVTGKGPVPPSTLRTRAIIFGCLLIPVNNFWVFAMERLGKGATVSTVSMLANATFILAILVALNAGIRKLSPRLAMSQMELLVVYSMNCIATSLMGFDWMIMLIHTIGHPYYYATPANQWTETFGMYLPKWLSVTDMNALKGLYMGDTTFYRPEFLRAWISPVFWWTMFTVVLLFVMMCINTILRKQWMERERLTFPIVQLPLAMTEPSGAIWRDRVFWAGFAIAAAAAIINGLHFLYPTVPQMWHDIYPPFDLKPLLVTKPWSGIDKLPIALYPFVVGLGFLLPTDLLFSCWFFYFFWKAQMVLTTAMAWDATPNFPFVAQQTYGAYLAVFAVTLWSGRSYFKEVGKRVVGMQSELDDSGEAMSYRAAAIGILIGMGLLTAFFVSMGLSPWIAVTCLMLYFWISASVARIRAELGSPVHDMSGVGPAQVWVQAFGTHGADPRGLTALSYFTWFTAAYRQHPIANEIEGMKMTQVTRGSQRLYMYAALLAAFFGMLAAFWAFLHFSYDRGLTNKIIGGTWRGDMMFGTYLYNWIKNPVGANVPQNIATVSGFLFCLLLGVLRIRFVGFPFHPIGFAISGGWSMNYVWLPLFIAWIIKATILRFGGLKMYKKALPFFFGIILGEVVVGMLWSVVSMIFNVTCYSMWTA